MSRSHLGFFSRWYQLASAGALPTDHAVFDEVVERAETCVRRAREHLVASSAARARDARSATVEPTEFEQSLERQLAVLDALLAKFRSAEVAADGGESLAADLDAAREVCDALDALIEAGEWCA